MVGCYNSTVHYNWILSNRLYNVRLGDSVNGGVPMNEWTTAPKYLLLYNVRAPRTYSWHRIEQCYWASNQQLQELGYQHPHCLQYLLYKIAVAADDAPAIDVMHLLRLSNDKVTAAADGRIRSSGTPIYLSGADFRRFLLAASLRQGGSEAPKRVYSNAAKPWTQLQDWKLTQFCAQGYSVIRMATELKRSVEEVKERVASLGLGCR